MAVEADTASFERSLDGLSRKANAFGAAFTGALKRRRSGDKASTG